MHTDSIRHRCFFGPLQVFEISDRLEILHVPGHTEGSVAVYYPSRRALFSGDLVYECGHGSALIDWLPTSRVDRYSHSAEMVADWLSGRADVTVYPGHFSRLNAGRAEHLLRQYVTGKRAACARGFTYCVQRVTTAFFLCGCFRCCPC